MLKMKRDFFNDKRINAIRKYPKGDRYVMLFQMLVRISENDCPRFALLDNYSNPLKISDIVYFCGMKQKLVEDGLILLDAYDLIEVIDGTIYVNISGLFEESSNCFRHEKKTVQGTPSFCNKYVL